VQPIQFLTIHCAATPEGRNVPAAMVEQWDRARFNQPSYHWIIELDGKAHRSLADNVKGAHVGGHNTGNIGICYVGGCDVRMKAKDTRTAAQTSALLDLCKAYRLKYPGIKIMGHRDWPNVRKDCPSFDVDEWLIEEGL
jgi:N-acetylmuramoyl-L-alanine amidase